MSPAYLTARGKVASAGGRAGRRDRTSQSRFEMDREERGNHLLRGAVRGRSVSEKKANHPTFPIIEECLQRVE